MPALFFVTCGTATCRRFGGAFEGRSARSKNPAITTHRWKSSVGGTSIRAFKRSESSHRAILDSALMFSRKCEIIKSLMQGCVLAAYWILTQFNWFRSSWDANPFINRLSRTGWKALWRQSLNVPGAALCSWKCFNPHSKQTT